MDSSALRTQGLRQLDGFPALPSAAVAEAEEEGLLYESEAAAVEMSGGGGGGDDEGEEDEGEGAAPLLCLPRGALRVTSRQVMWLANDSASAVVAGFAVDFYSIGLHALSSDGAMAEGGRPCVYLQLADREGATYGDAEEEDEESAMGGEDGPPRLEEVLEMKIFLDDSASAEMLYSKLCEAAEMNPDDDEYEDEYEDGDDDVDLGDYHAGGYDGGINADGDDVDLSRAAPESCENGHTARLVALGRRFDDMLQVPAQFQQTEDEGGEDDSRFDDAEDDLE